MSGEGFTAQSWAGAKVFTGRCATQADVDAGAAVFALGDTLDGQAFEEPLPQPVIWYDEDEAVAALIVQAEAHETPAGERLEILGLLLPNGQTRIGFVEDVEEVRADDPAWLDLVEAGLQGDRMNVFRLEP